MAKAGEMVNTGRRERNRAARHTQLVSAASAIVTEKGLDALTMGEVAARVDCAVGTIYTYFSSKSSLVAALQADAVRVLTQSYETAANQWDGALGDTDPGTASLARMVAMGRLFVNWQRLQPKEFDFLQMLSMYPGRILTPQDIAGVLPLVLRLFAEARVLHDDAVATGAVTQDLDRPGDEGIERTVRWIAALNGAILVNRAVAEVAGDLDPNAFNEHLMAETMTNDYLLAWGATREKLGEAVAVADAMSADGSLLPEPI